MKETFYFSHDYNARNDPKLLLVLMKLGHEGKSVYWDLIEMLYEQQGYLVMGDIENYAFALRTHIDIINKLIHDFDLFENDTIKFWSKSVLFRLKIRHEKSEKARKSALLRWKNSEGKNANASKKGKKAVTQKKKGNAIKESKLKEIKLKENKLKEEGEAPHDFEIPSFEDVKNYQMTHHLKFDPKVFFSHYEGNGWIRGKEPIKNWQAVCDTWHSRVESDELAVKNEATGGKGHVKAKTRREMMLNLIDNEKSLEDTENQKKTVTEATV